MPAATPACCSAVEQPIPTQAPVSGVTRDPPGGAVVVPPIAPGGERPLAGFAADGGLPLKDEEALGTPAIELEVPVGLLNSGTLTWGGGAPNVPLGPSTVLGDPGTLLGAPPMVFGTVDPGILSVLPGTPPKPAPTPGVVPGAVTTPGVVPKVFAEPPGPA